MQTESPVPPLETIDPSQLSSASGGGAAETIAKIGEQGLPLLQSALPVIQNAASVIEGWVKQ